MPGRVISWRLSHMRRHAFWIVMVVLVLAAAVVFATGFSKEELAEMDEEEAPALA